jgi:catechol 2,3-dioxygenase-like lactoylglutathione lyase family enzyme
MIRLRQVALVAADLDREVDALCTTLGLRVCFNDPGVGAFGLHNALMVIGDQFLEVVSPTEEGTTAGRLLDKRHGDGGYMAIYEVDDLDRRVDHLQAHGVRIVWSGDLPDIRGRHLHPRDVGGTLVSVDQPVPNGSWTWGGPCWVAHGETSVVAAIAGVVVGATDPEAMRARWRELEIDTAVRVVEAGPRGEGLDGVDLVASDRDRVGEVHELCGTRFVLV